MARLIEKTYQHALKEARSDEAHWLGGTVCLAFLDAHDRAEAAEALVKVWEEKARNWFASPEAARRLEGYRELGDKLAAAEARVQELEAALAIATAAIKSITEAHPDA